MNIQRTSIRLNLGARSHDVDVGSGSLNGLGERCRAIGLSGKVALVSSPPVNSLYGDSATASLCAAGFDVVSLLLPDGEEAKSLSHAEELLSGFADAGLNRTDTVVALGGGTIGDTAGFAAATYLRGVSLVHVPTTLLAQVDSAIGGKTGVNLRQGKNLVGAIWQPRMVLCDTALLRSLPVRDVASGLAEVLKYGLIARPTILDDITSALPDMLNSPPSIRADLVQKCVQIKANVVSSDEREGDRRRVLNFGHTFGHALEAATSYGTLLHGEAVALGMFVGMELSVQLAGASSDELDPARLLLKKIFGSLAFPDVGFSALATAMMRDKKVAHGKMIWVLLEAPGKPVFVEIESMDIVARAYDAAHAEWSRS